ncbi:MAG: hypothetical protein FGF53_08825 [Candidatus Brockarchaeota archaeon]|nr:hypothetical protein [Candidatus Brockarchaeota archaeon]
MVEIMEEKLNMDKQGRIILPARIRKALGMEKGGELLPGWTAQESYSSLSPET